MIEKKDWKAAKIQVEAIKLNKLVSKELADYVFEDEVKTLDKNIEFCKKKIAEFPDDPMPEEAKAMSEALK